MYRSLNIKKFNLTDYKIYQIQLLQLLYAVNILSNDRVTTIYRMTENDKETFKSYHYIRILHITELYFKAQTSLYHFKEIGK